MRTIIFLLMMLPATVKAQQEFTFSKVDSVDASRAELFTRANEWINYYYRSLKSVTQFSDKEAGKIICKGYFSVKAGMFTYRVLHTVTIDVKDQKYRIKYNDFFYEDDNSHYLDNLDKDRSRGGLYGLMPGAWRKLKAASEIEAKEAIADCVKFMHKPTGDDF